MLNKSEFQPLSDDSDDADVLLYSLAFYLICRRITLNNEEFELLNKGRLDYEYVYYPFVGVSDVFKTMNIVMSHEQSIRFHYICLAQLAVGQNMRLSSHRETEECDSITHDIINQLKELTDAQ